MLLKAKRDRKFPDLSIGDKVHVLLTYDKFEKEHQPTFSDFKYEVDTIKEKHG